MARVKARIEISVPDDWLTERVAEFNRDNDPDVDPTTTLRYATEVLQDMVVDDALPIALWSWPIDATLVIEEPPA